MMISGSRLPSGPFRVGCSASTRADGFRSETSVIQYNGGSFCQMAWDCSGESPSCIDGLASPISVGWATNPSVSGLFGSGLRVLAGSNGISRASGVSR